MNGDILLEARNITKRYPGNIALDDVTLRVYRNQINVLIGENGAGKSTLMRILAGVETPDAGELLLNGNLITVRSPREASAHGIAIVHQELAILPNLDISENIFAGRELTRANTTIDRAQEDTASNTALHHLRTPMRVQTTTSQLSLGNRQIVEIARTLAHGSKLLILDEPTSALSLADTESLFTVLADLKQSGVTIIYISHRLYELLHLGDHFTVLRSGRVVGEAPRSEVTREWIVERMSGRSETLDLRSLANVSTQNCHPERAQRAEGPVVASIQPELLRVTNLSLTASTGNEEAQAALHNITFTIRKGEVLGIYGLLGAGRTELLEALAGARPILSGEISFNQKTLHLRSVPDATRAGIALVPEDRQRDGLIPELSIRENVALAAAAGPFLSRAEETTRVRVLATKLNIAARDLELPVTALSGGNQQKILLARCLMLAPMLLLLDEPTRGVDATAKTEIYRILRSLAAEGLTILFTSSEIEETRILADRVLVLCQGRIAAELAHDQITDEALFTAASPRVTAGASA